MTMKLSEAIRLGSMMVPQAFRAEYSYNFRGKIIAACALGAAKLAIGVGEQDLGQQVYANWPWTMAIETKYSPENAEPSMVNIACLITQLNDLECWSREQIADWVEQYENERHVYDALPAPAAEEEAVTVG